MKARLLVVAVLCTVALPLAAQEQEQNCFLDLQGGRAEGTGGVTNILDPFIVTCDDGAVVSANSGHIAPSRVVTLIGDVYFEDPERQLMAKEAVYDPNTAHLIARGDVVYTDKLEGSILRGPELEYFRATEDRPQAQMTATRRPTMTLVQQTAEGGAEPIELVSDRVLMVGENDLSAFGTVVITRSDFSAASEEARYNAETEDLELRQSARITSQDQELKGEVIQARLAGNALEHVRARASAELRGEDLLVTGEDLQMFFVDEKLERAVAVGGGEGEKSLAEASSPGFRMVSDSLDAKFVDEQLSEVHAIGRARAETVDTTATQPLRVEVAAKDTIRAAPGDSAALAGTDTTATAVPGAAHGAGTPDLAALDLLGSDWVSGDTIIGYFEPTETAAGNAAAEAPGIVPDPSGVEPADDPAASVEVRRIVAIGSAQSLYRLRPQNDPNAERQDLNLVIGDRIELEIADGELEVAAVTGLEYGIYLEASSPTVEPVDAAPAAPAGDVPAPGGGV